MSVFQSPDDNVFLNAPAGGNAAADDSGGNTSSLAATLSTLRVRLRSVDDGFEMTLQPMRPGDALEAFTHGSGAGSSNLLLGRGLASAASDGSLRPLSECLLADSVRGAEVLAPDAIVVNDRVLARVSANLPRSVAAIVRIEGPVELSDAEWIARGLRRGDSALASELRATHAMIVRPKDTLVVQTRERYAALRFAAEQMRAYMAALRRARPADIAAPDPGLLAPLVERTGELTVRPLESDVFSTAVDVGVATSPSESPRPADSSLIYDLYANTWHGE